MSFISTAADIWNSMQTNNWPESFDNCYQYGACAYFKLCQQYTEVENLNTENYHVDFWDVRKEVN